MYHLPYLFYLHRPPTSLPPLSAPLGVGEGNSFVCSVMFTTQNFDHTHFQFQTTSTCLWTTPMGECPFRNDDYVPTYEGIEEWHVYRASNGYELNTKVVGDDDLYLTGLRTQLPGIITPQSFLKLQIGPLKGDKVGSKALKTPQSYSKAILTLKLKRLASIPAY